MPTTVKVRLRADQELADGKYAIAIVITKNRKVRRDTIGYCSIEEWNDTDLLVKVNKTNRIDAENINRTIRSRKARAERIVSELEAEDPFIPIEDIMIKLRGKDLPQVLDFFQYAYQTRDWFIENGKFDSGACYQAMISNLSKYLGSEKLSFRQITLHFLESYQTYLGKKKTGKDPDKQKPISQNTIFAEFKYIASVMNKAERNGLIKAENNPFKKFKVHSLRPKQLKPIKDHLTKEEINKIKALDLVEDSEIWHCRNAFFLAIDFAGMRVFDIMMLKVYNIQNGRLFYSMKKSDDAFGWIISEDSQKVFDHYLKGKSNKDFVFPFFDLDDEKDPAYLHSKKKSKTKIINGYLQKLADLAGVKKHITSHVARHTFAGLTKGILSDEEVQNLLGHEDKKTTMAYRGRIGQDELNDALKRVRGE